MPDYLSVPTCVEWRRMMPSIPHLIRAARPYGCELNLHSHALLSSSHIKLHPPKWYVKLLPSSPFFRPILLRENTKKNESETSLQREQEV
ncbi:hypothetical protein I308_106694 [Cryptococcus tetragattii IND107]|uniref:Uncharacterized protein n=1 Tax=Cryptococcus tetragattii IND107 TaxID=1296105 RepID=A0ABR3BIC2_9TREE